jgi:hypothetical protein
MVRAGDVERWEKCWEKDVESEDLTKMIGSKGIEQGDRRDGVRSV